MKSLFFTMMTLGLIGGVLSNPARAANKKICVARDIQNNDDCFKVDLRLELDFDQGRFTQQRIYVPHQRCMRWPPFSPVMDGTISILQAGSAASGVGVYALEFTSWGLRDYLVLNADAVTYVDVMAQKNRPMTCEEEAPAN